MASHSAIVTVAKRAPLELAKYPTVTPANNEVLVRISHTAAGPLELHQADGGLLITHPLVLNDAIVGTVVELGPNVQHLAVGDEVFGYSFAETKQRSWQSYATVPEDTVGKIPANITAEQAATVPVNAVTAFHTLVTDLGLELPWPKPEGYRPEKDERILVWGGSSSVGQYVLQVLKYYGHKHVTAVASGRHHDMLKALGAEEVVDYNEGDVVGRLNAAGGFELMLDCIGSKEGSVAVLAEIARAGDTVAIMLPVILRDATAETAPEYEMDVGKAAEWRDGVEVRGVRTHLYQQNERHKRLLQREIVPTLVRDGVIVPNKVRLVEGKDMLERAQKCIDLLREKKVSGEKLVFRLDEEELGL